MSTPRTLLTLATVAACASLVVAGCGGPSENLTDSQARQEAQMKAEDPTKAASDDQSEMPSEPMQSTEKDSEGEAGKLTADQLASAKTIFSNTCGGCHTLSAAGTGGAVGPNLDGTKLSKEQIATQIMNGKGGMPGALLQGDDVDLVAAYVAESAAG